MGFLQRELLISLGLKPSDFLVDVGCGSGRTLKQMASYLTNGKYLGIDVVPELIEFASRFLAGHPGWRLELAKGLSIPAQNGSADVVCFFSVLTHLRHEESYVYLRDALRVLKPGGMIVVSFLEFAAPNHWWIFEGMIEKVDERGHLNQFMSRDTFDRFAEHLGCTVEKVLPGDHHCIPLSKPVELARNTRYEGFGTLGQSVVVLRKSA
jgi:ubiquinone/menaquinone biosynthesis C-methylase UbiE